jgi:TRAP-type C4-dicarboxylate transport system permease large subunit
VNGQGFAQASLNSMLVPPSHMLIVEGAEAGMETVVVGQMLQNAGDEWDMPPRRLWMCA